MKFINSDNYVSDKCVYLTLQSKSIERVSKKMRYMSEFKLEENVCLVQNHNKMWVLESTIYIME